MHRIGPKCPLSNSIQRRIVSLAQNEIRICSLLASASSSASSTVARSFPKGQNHSQTQKSNFYSNDGPGSNSSKSPFKEIKEAPGKVKKNTPISKTPRGQAKARAKPSKSSVEFRGSNSQTNISIQEQQQHLTHFVRGGTPSDPLKAPFRLADYGDDSLYTLVLLRHGESEWNSLNKYTGWCDVNLTENGRQEARAAGRLLNENGVEVDHVFTSVLKRAIFTTNMALNTAEQHFVPITKTWRLNERHYGALQGYNKDTAYEELDIDQELVMEMRRSYDTRPPKMEDDHPYWHGKERR
jgi:hypothetical protein